MEGCAEDVLSCVHTVYYYYCTKGEYRDPLKQVKSTINASHTLDEKRHDDLDSWRQVRRWELTSAVALSGRGGG